MRRRLTAAMTACALAAGFANAPSPASALYGQGDPFCAPRVVHPYMKPLERLPRLNSLYRNVPGFKSDGSVHVEGAQEYEEMTLFTDLEPHKAGYFVGYDADAGRLDWVVTAKLSIVHPKSRLAELLGSRQKSVGTPLDDTTQDFRFSLPQELGIYRIEIVFRDSRGKVLGRFGKYIRILPVRPDVAFLLSSATYRPGETVLGRIDNYGTTTVTYGVGYVIQRLDGTAWSPAPETPKGFILPELGTPPGRGGYYCSTFTIPPAMPPGHYRMVKNVATMGSGGKRLSLTFYPEFDIVP